MKNKRKLRIIKNQDIPLLSRVLYTMQNVCSIEKRIEWQKDRMVNIEQRITGMPRGKGLPVGFDAIFEAIDGINEEYMDRLNVYVDELKEAERILNSIKDERMKTFVVMVYVNGVPQEKVREALNMTTWGYRMALERIEQAKNMESVKWDEKFELHA